MTRNEFDKFEEIEKKRSAGRFDECERQDFAIFYKEEACQSMEEHLNRLGMFYLKDYNKMLYPLSQFDYATYDVFLQDNKETLRPEHFIRIHIYPQKSFFATKDCKGILYINLRYFNNIMSDVESKHTLIALWSKEDNQFRFKPAYLIKKYIARKIANDPTGKYGWKKMRLNLESSEEFQARHKKRGTVGIRAEDSGSTSFWHIGSWNTQTATKYMLEASELWDLFVGQHLNQYNNFWRIRFRAMKNIIDGI